MLRTLDTIACRDAILADDGTIAVWPPADVIVGNPPFLVLLVLLFRARHIFFP